MGKLAGKVAVITGGSSGIGLATARQFVNEGAHVFITGRRQSELDSAVARIGKCVTAVAGDVTSLADLDRLYETVQREKGRIDVLFANAGISSPRAPWVRFASRTSTRYLTSTSERCFSPYRRRCRCSPMADRSY